MYENVIAQDDIVSVLSHDIANASLPRAILFEGAPYKAKLTTALETARILSCESGTMAAWNCDCVSCRRHRILSHPDLLVLGSRSFRAEISASGEALLKVPGVQTRYLFLRSCRKLLKRFDPLLYAGEESRLSKALGPYLALDEIADSFDPSGPKSDVTAEPIERKKINQAIAMAEKLEALVPGTVPVFMIRSIEAWSRLATNGRKKTVIVENADRMLDASRNALLKLLEEPPENTQLILITSRKQAMIDTILSRLRPYHFKTRSRAEENGIAKRLFQSEALFGFDRFFQTHLPAMDGELSKAAKQFIAGLSGEFAARHGASGAFARYSRETRPDDARMGESADEALSRVSAATKSFGASDDSFEYTFVSFLEALAREINSLIRFPGVLDDELDVMDRWMDALRDAEAGYVSFNLNAGALSERLLQAMRTWM